MMKNILDDLVYYVLRACWFVYYKTDDMINRWKQKPVPIPTITSNKGQEKIMDPISYTFDKDPKPVFIGYEYLDQELHAVANDLYKDEFDPTHWPFYRIFRSGTHYSVEVHIASFQQTELNVTVDDKGVMTVAGTKPDAPIDTANMVVFDGIKQPSTFKRQFQLADNLLIESVGYADGCLTISLKIVNVANRVGDYGSDFKDGDKPTPPAPAVDPLPAPAPPLPVDPVVVPSPVPTPAVDPVPVPEPAPSDPIPVPTPAPDPVPAQVPTPPVVAPPAPVAPPPAVVVSKPTPAPPHVTLVTTANVVSQIPVVSKT